MNSQRVKDIVAVALVSFFVAMLCVGVISMGHDKAYVAGVSPSAIYWIPSSGMDVTLIGLFGSLGAIIASLFLVLPKGD